MAAMGLGMLAENVANLDYKIVNYKICAEKGDMTSQFKLGFHLLRGTGISVDKCEAFKWFKRAAKSGHIESMYEYGTCYLDGQGVAMDKHEGIKWLTRSAEAGLLCRIQRRALVEIYDKGDGVTVDIHAAIK